MVLRRYPHHTDLVSFRPRVRVYGLDSLHLRREKKVFSLGVLSPSSAATLCPG